jgi:hypothetical protein
MTQMFFTEQQISKYCCVFEIPSRNIIEEYIFYVYLFSNNYYKQVNVMKLLA